VPRLAIACQGGGAHTAFTAGVLAYLFLSFEHFRTIGEEALVQAAGPLRHLRRGDHRRHGLERGAG
jgi:hypothetical protein